MFHPQRQPNGTLVKIQHPTLPTPPATWDDWQAVATFVPKGPVPERLNDLPVTAVPPEDATRLAMLELDEPPFTPPPGLAPAAGAVVVEPQGRVWVVHPTNAFGGYQATFPKGRIETGVSLHATAMREVLEEAGLQVAPFAFLADSQRSTTFTRYYLAKRLGGSPAAMGWESQAVSLVPLQQLKAFLNRAVDQALVAALLAREGDWGHWFSGTGILVAGHRVATRYSWVRQPLPPQQRTLAIDVRLDATQAARLRRGFIPKAMEQKWFAYFEDGILYQHRSWTGILIFVTPFTSDGNGLRATQTWVNQDPAQYSVTDERELRQTVEGLILDLASAPANEDLTDPFVATLAKALGPKYLGAQEVVRQEVEAYLNLLVQRWLTIYLKDQGPGVSADQVYQANARLARIFAGEDPAYTVIGAWNSVEQLGVALVEACGLDADYCAGENLGFIVSEALAAVSIAVTSLLREMRARELDWASEVQPRLQALGEFVVSVLLGTHEVFYPGKTLRNFSPMSPTTA
jgi:ADP-ribose pyrophosphatase YjhB (NUDIX family)